MIKKFFKYGFVLVFLSLFAVDVMAQQLSTFTHYRELLTVINPGALPLNYSIYDNEPKLFLGATWKDRGVAIQRPPSTKLLNIDYILTANSFGGLILGGYVLQDRNGIFETTRGYGKVAAVIDLYAGELAAGLSLGFAQRSLNFRGGNPGNIVDDFSGTGLDVGLGVFYRQEFKRRGFFYTGLSVPQVRNVWNSTIVTDDSTEFEKESRHYYYNFGVVHYFSDDSFIEPSIWAKYIPNYQNAPVGIDLNIHSQIANRLSVMAGYSTQTKLLQLSVGVLQKWDKGLLKIAFGYGHPLTDNLSLLGNWHEYQLYFNH